MQHWHTRLDPRAVHIVTHALAYITNCALLTNTPPAAQHWQRRNSNCGAEQQHTLMRAHTYHSYMHTMDNVMAIVNHHAIDNPTPWFVQLQELCVAPTLQILELKP